MRIDHIAIAVDDLDSAIALYEKLLGVRATKRERVVQEGVEVAKFALENCRIELMMPLSGESPVGRFLSRRGPGLHHIALEPEDFDAKCAQIRTFCELIGSAHKGSEEKRIQFIHPKSTGGVLLELCKPQHKKSC